MNTVYSIYCATGCTCCNDENHYYGFFSKKEDADSQAQKWRSGQNSPLASQYSKYGNYDVGSHSAETLPDGRIIIDGDRVFSVESQSEWPRHLGREI